MLCTLEKSRAGPDNTLVRIVVFRLYFGGGGTFQCGLHFLFNAGVLVHLRSYSLDVCLRLQEVP